MVSMRHLAQQQGITMEASMEEANDFIARLQEQLPGYDLGFKFHPQADGDVLWEGTPEFANAVGIYLASLN
jgi:hypothetical protein